MSRLGEWLLEVITPYPRLAGFLFYVRNPHVFVAKALRVLRRARRARTCRALLDGGKLIVEVGPAGRTLFTIATPVWRVAEEHLRAAIDSVRRQSYPHWELWLADDASPDPHVRRVLALEARRDPRIKTLHLPDNLGIAGASDAILARATGEYVGFLDHDDLLHPRALELVSAHLANHPEVDWVFTDEDKVDERGRHREPCLKPGWSRHLLLTFNYVAHFRVVRRAMLERVGGHRRGFDGAQDYDLALRVLAAGGRFSHLRGVLYHWRVVPGSMARAAADKPAAHSHALQALSQHAATWPSGGPITASVLLAPASFFRVRRAAPEQLEVSLLTDGAAPLPAGRRTREVVALPRRASLHAVLAAVERAAAPVVVRWPHGAPTDAELAELLALLQVPQTAVVAPRLVNGARVAASGWWLRDSAPPAGGRRAPTSSNSLVAAPPAAELEDPWRSLRLQDPGYLNLALVPGPRLAPPDGAWAAWRGAYLRAWEAGAGAPDDWRVPLGLARAGLEVIVTPTVSVSGEATAPPAGEVPTELPRHGTCWLHQLGVADAGHW